MAHPCCVQFCKNIGTHHFPKEETQKNRWIQAIKVKPGLTLRKNSLICSAHFRPTDIAVTYVSGHARKTIKKNAVPSIFAWNQQQDEIFEKLVFDPSKVQTTYSRPPPIPFIEAYPFLDVQIKEEVDPLQVSNQEVDYQQAETVGNDIISNQAKKEESVQDISKDFPQLFTYLLNKIDDNVIEIDSRKSVKTQTNVDNSQKNQGISKETKPEQRF